MLQSRARQLGLRLRLRDPGSAMTSDSIACLHVPLSYTCRAGTLDRRSAPYVISLLDRAIAGCKAGEFVALTNAAPGGSGSVSTTLLAVEGPRFVMRTV